MNVGYLFGHDGHDWCHTATGVQVVDRDLRGVANDHPRTVGIYKPPWNAEVWIPSKVDKRVLYHEDVWIGVAENAKNPQFKPLC